MLAVARQPLLPACACCLWKAAARPTALLRRAACRRCCFRRAWQQQQRKRPAAAHPAAARVAAAAAAAPAADAAAAVAAADCCPRATWLRTARATRPAPQQSRRAGGGRPATRGTGRAGAGGGPLAPAGRRPGRLSLGRAPARLPRRHSRPGGCCSCWPWLAVGGCRRLRCRRRLPGAASCFLMRCVACLAATKVLLVAASSGRGRTMPGSRSRGAERLSEALPLDKMLV